MEGLAKQTIYESVDFDFAISCYDESAQHVFRLLGNLMLRELSQLYSRRARELSEVD